MRIGLCGTMSVGKTTLVNELKEVRINLKVLSLLLNVVNI
jgi:broad-specificity NMP kinase